jgi:hypothetical protein
MKEAPQPVNTETVRDRLPAQRGARIGIVAGAPVTTLVAGRTPVPTALGTTLRAVPLPALLAALLATLLALFLEYASRGAAEVVGLCAV